MNERQRLALRHPIDSGDPANIRALSARATRTTTGGVSMLVILAVDR